MGRKIPKSRKHNKLKSVDPCSKSRSIAKRKEFCNQPPENLDDQHMPRKLQELIRMKNFANTKRIKKKRKHRDEYISVTSDKYEGQQKGMTKPLKYIPEKMKQKENESEGHFLWRIQQLTNHSITEAQMEAKYDIDVTDDKGEGVGKSPVAGTTTTTAPTRKQLKRKALEEKKKEKRRKKLEDQIDDYGHLTDEVKFGETVIQPPKLIAPKRAKVQLKAGQKQLKLKSSS